MKNKGIVFLAFVIACCTVFNQYAFSDNDGDSIVISGRGRGKYIDPTEFSSLGDWKIKGFDLALQKFALTGVSTKDPLNLKPASISIKVEKDGYYSLWVSSLDLPNNQPGTRFFYMRIDDQIIQKKLGVHNKRGFKWEEVKRLYFRKGAHLIEFIDSSAFYARSEGLYITPEKDLTSDVIVQRIKATTASYKSVKLPPPFRPSSNAIRKKHETLSNDRVSIDFYELADLGRNIVENKIRLDGEVVKSQKSSLALILLKAESSQVFYSEGFPVFHNKLIISDRKPVYVTSSDPYDAFLSDWLIPEKIERVSSNVIKLSYISKDIRVEAFWKLEKNDREPTIRIVMEAKTTGLYSLIVPGYRSFNDDDYSFALAPMRVTNKHVHPNPVVYTEQYLFTPMVAVSFPDTGVRPTKELTAGFVMDPASLKFKWTYKEDNQFGMMLRGRDSKISPSIIAPFPGSDSSYFKKGQKRSFVFRPIFSTKGWFSAYRHVVGDIFRLRDYRQNYYSTLNSAIFETTKLMMDNYYGGWDSIGKAHWNMEGRSFTSNANPVQAVQSYLLSGNDSILKKRAIPTLANLLTRESIHFKWDNLRGGANYFGGKATFPRPIGKPIKGYNASVFLGLYQASQGRTPYLKAIAEKKARGKAVNAYGSIPSFKNKITYFKLTGDSSILKQAIAEARKYVKNVVYSTDLKPIPYSSFSYISYVPNLAALLDIYELTNMPEFLKAAEETGHILLTQLWVPGITPAYTPDSILIRADELKNRPFMAGHDFFWHGEEVWRPGSRPGVKGPPENLDILRDEKVPSWVPSRVGLGLEQPSTFLDESLNMIMSCWAGDLMKLAGYTGDSLFATAARNAIIGRFSNYPGYYQNRFITIQQKPDYPYVGPDFTSIYWHHIPPFLAMLEGFLFAQAKFWSKGKVQFPSFRQEGYAYFTSNQYGYKSGRFFDELNMWPWLKKDIVSTSSLQVDWLAARKDGVVGIAFMNESATGVAATIYLGSAVGSDYSGPATLCYPNGSRTTIHIKSGQLEIMLKGHGLVGLIIRKDDIKKPSYANSPIVQKDQKVRTFSDHGHGKGIILQLDPQKYFAYVYLTEKPEQLKKAVLNFRLEDGKWRRKMTSQYPFEFIIEVDDPQRYFEYFIELEYTNGKKITTGHKIIKSIDEE